MSFILLATSVFSEETSWTDGTGYAEFCKLASVDEQLFASFKRHPAYTPILEHVSFQQGLEYLSIFQEVTPEYFCFLESFRLNDRIGNPEVFNYGDFGFFSPTTLRYMKVISDLKIHFGSLDDKDVIEIGGGYGGQCFVLSKVCKFRSYTIVDLPEVIPLIRKYLDLLGVDHVTCVSPDEFWGKNVYDLVISNYAFSECFRDMQNFYMNKILLRSRCGYLTCNNDPSFKGIMAKEELINQFKFSDIDCCEFSEKPLTGPNNYFLIWADAFIKD